MKTLGTINGFNNSSAKFGRKSFAFNGTTLGLTIAALAAGAKAGSSVKADFGAGFRSYIIAATPWDSRAGGFWAKAA